APVLHRDPGTSGAAVAADTGAPALHRPGPRCPGPQGRARAGPAGHRPRRLSAVGHPVSGAPDRAGIADRAGRNPVASTAAVVHGGVWEVVPQTVRLPGGEQVVRDIVEHPGAVAVVAMDEDERILVVPQSRHAAAATLWELPAGLLDV